jgi:hypothetical protein
MKRLMLSFLKFAGLSGIGWLLDASMLIVIIYFTILPSSPGNIVSSCTASLTVSLLSRELVFYKASGAGLRRLFWYLLYTLTVILAASCCSVRLLRYCNPRRRLLAGLGSNDRRRNRQGSGNAATADHEVYCFAVPERAALCWSGLNGATERFKSDETGRVPLRTIRQAFLSGHASRRSWLAHHQRDSDG